MEIQTFIITVFDFNINLEILFYILFIATNQKSLKPLTFYLFKGTLIALFEILPGGYQLFDIWFQLFQREESILNLIIKINQKKCFVYFSEISWKMKIFGDYRSKSFINILKIYFRLMSGNWFNSITELRKTNIKYNTNIKRLIKSEKMNLLFIWELLPAIKYYYYSHKIFDYMSVPYNKRVCEQWIVNKTEVPLLLNLKEFIKVWLRFWRFNCIYKLNDKTYTGFLPLLIKFL